MSRSLRPPIPLLAGIARLAVFNRDGFAAIGNTRQDFLSSLSPLVAFLLVGSVMQAVGMGWRAGVGQALQTLCVLVGQPVGSQLLAQFWKRDGPWLRYATALNWCQFAIPVAGLVFATLALMASSAGAPPHAVVYGLIGAIGIYALALNCFLAWRGLDLRLWQALMLVGLVTIGLAALLALPAAARAALTGAAAANLQT